MLGFIVWRLGLLIPTLLGVTLLTFMLIRLIPDDPVEAMMGERRVGPQMYAEALHRLGPDKPLHQQYLDYADNLVQGNLGESLITHEGVWHGFLTLFPVILELSLVAMLFAGTFGLLAGVTVALKRGSLFDHGAMTVSLAGYSTPIFWWGLTLIMLFPVSPGWVPVSGRLDLLYDAELKTGFMLTDTPFPDGQGSPLDAARHLTLSAVVLGTILLAMTAHMTRSAMLRVLREDHVRTIRAKGLSPARVVFVHALRNALIPVLTVFGLQAGTLLAGAVLTEIIFSWPDIDKWLIDTISRRDYPVVQNDILLVATLVTLVNSAVGILYGLANPHTRHQR